MQSSGVWCRRLGSVLLMVLVVSGCPRRTPPPSEVSPSGGIGPSGVGEGTIPSPGERTEARIEGKGESGPLQDIYFAYDAFDLSPEARETLRANAGWLQTSSQARVEVEGHCDERGTAEYNLALGAKRAKAARDYLVTLGVAPERLSTISYGEELPLCRDTSESCWQQNRRAHFLVLNR
jgi:peptidoglycan-associated lipoprotein